MSSNNISKLFALEKVNHPQEEILQFYQDNGILYLKEFINTQACSSILSEIDLAQINAENDIKNNWDGHKVCFYSKNPAKQALEKKEYVTEPYFKQSHDKAHVFYEEIDNVLAVNRIGHGLHLRDEYKTIQQLVYHNDHFHSLLKLIGLKKPICQLSVYIPKYPNGIGSDVRPHQESTFAYTEPQTVVVLWIALEDALIENACMWGILGSNRWPLKYVSRVDHVANTRHFQQVNDVNIPDFLLEQEYFTPLEVRRGDALLFHGNFIHCSPVNLSQHSRKALSLQFIDATDDIFYPNTNWLQPPNKKYLY